MRVLLLDQYRDVGGAQTVLLQVLGCLVSRGFEVAAAIPIGGGLEATIRERFGEGVELIAIPELALTPRHKSSRDAVRLAGYSAGLLRLAPSLRRFHYVYVHGPRLFPAFAGLSSLISARYVYHVHLEHSRLEKSIIRGLLWHPRTHAVIAPSEFVMRGLGSRANRGRLRLVENALSETMSALPFVDRWADAERLDLVAVGRLIPEKGQDVVLDLAANFGRHRFHLIGCADPARPEYAAALRRRATPNVVFHGQVGDVASTIHQIGAQVCLVPSRRDESFGLAAIEGMACSCLTVTSGRGGLGNIAERTGAWTARTAEEWRAAIERIEGSAPDEMAHAAREQHDRTLDCYGFERFARDVAEIFSSETAR